ncbi:MAG: polysaccharide biosynthesis tyrosine autokinase [Parvibaculaceae bacterium]|nr:polysaccharide biosynthesis tyrosine autokinase [Parvibaculaceae bacterium]
MAERSTSTMASNQVIFGDRRRRTSESEGAADINPWELMRGIWARKEIVLMTFLAVLAIGIFWLSTLTPTYTVETLLLIEPRIGEISRFDETNTLSTPDKGFVESEIQIISSYEQLLKLADRLSLSKYSEFAQATKSKGPNSKGQIGAPASSPTKLVETLRKNLNIMRRGESRVISIQYTSIDPVLATQVANELASLYIQQQVSDRMAIHRQATDWLSSQIESLRTRTTSSETAVENFRTKSGLFEANGATLPQRELSEVSTQLVLAEATQSEAVARLELAEDLIASPEGRASAAEVLQSSLIQTLRAREVELKAQISEMSTSLLPQHPRMITAQANLRDMQSEIESEITKILQALENEAQVAAARVASLRRNVSRLKSKLGRMNKEEVTLRAFEREAAANRTLLESFLTRYEESLARMQADTQAANARILSKAHTPLNPSFPRKTPMLILTILGAVTLSLMVAFVMEVFSSGFRTADQVERITGMPFLGLLPKSRSRNPVAAAAEVLHAPNGLLAESLRGLLGHILLAQVDGRPAKSLLVASSVPGEGKSPVAMGLARIMAMGGYQVLVIDADMRRPVQNHIAGIGNGPGLAELLSGRAEFIQTIHQDTASTVHVLQTGGQLGNSTAALGSERMAWIMDTLGKRYDFIIVDSPAMSTAADGQVLARLCDLTLLAVRWGVTDRKVVQRVLKTR